MTSGVARVERALLGSLLVAPYLSERCQALKPADFSDPTRGRVFIELLELGEFADANTLVLALEHKNVRPSGNKGWGVEVGKLLEDYCITDESVSHYAQKIKEAAIERRLAARSQSGSSY